METPLWVGYVGVAVVGVLLGRWSKAMKKLGELHKASHSVRGGAQSAKNETGSQYVHVSVGAGAGSNVAHGAVGGSGAADVHRGDVDRLYRWIPDGASLMVQGYQFAYEMPLDHSDTAFELESHLVSLGLPQPTVRASGNTLVVSGELPRGDRGDSPDRSSASGQ